MLQILVSSICWKNKLETNEYMLEDNNQKYIVLNIESFCRTFCSMELLVKLFLQVDQPPHPRHIIPRFCRACSLPSLSLQQFGATFLRTGLGGMHAP
jgi:hypothetical protein